MVYSLLLLTCIHLSNVFFYCDTHAGYSSHHCPTSWQAPAVAGQAIYYLTMYWPLFFIGRSMLHTNRHLLEWDRESDARAAAYNIVLSMGRNKQLDKDVSSDMC